MPKQTDLAPLAYSIPEATRVSPFGKTRLYELAKEGRIEIRKVGNRSFIPAASLRRLIDEAQAA